MPNDFPVMCNHTETMAWFPVDFRGDPMLIQQYALGHGKPVKTWEKPFVSLTICLDCGITFASNKPADQRKRKAATLRMLQRKVRRMLQRKVSKK